MLAGRSRRKRERADKKNPHLQMEMKRSTVRPSSEFFCQAKRWWKRCKEQKKERQHTNATYKCWLKKLHSSSTIRTFLIIGATGEWSLASEIRRKIIRRPQLAWWLVCRASIRHLHSPSTQSEQSAHWMLECLHHLEHRVDRANLFHPLSLSVCLPLDSTREHHPPKQERRPPIPPVTHATRLPVCLKHTHYGLKTTLKLQSGISTSLHRFTFYITFWPSTRLDTRQAMTKKCCWPDHQSKLFWLLCFPFNTLCVSGCVCRVWASFWVNFAQFLLATAQQEKDPAKTTKNYR